ncbi:hypothetical protein RFI_19509, partial [Reticulomyxa filosa]
MIGYDIREYNRNLGEIMATVDNPTWTVDDLKPDHEYCFTISGIHENGATTEESWPVIVKTPMSNDMTPQMMKLSTPPKNIRTFRMNGSSSSSSSSSSVLWICWDSPYTGLGLISYKMKRTESDSMTTTKKQKKQEFTYVANPLPSLSNDYSLTLSTWWTYKQRQHASVPSESVSILRDSTSATDSEHMLHVILLTNKELYGGSYVLHSIVSDADVHMPFEKVSNDSNVYWCLYDLSTSPLKTKAFHVRVKCKEKNSRNNKDQFKLISEDRWKVEPFRRVLIIDITERKSFFNYRSIPHDEYEKYLLGILEHLYFQLNAFLSLPVALNVLQEFLIYCAKAKNDRCQAVNEKDLKRKISEFVKEKLYLTMNEPSPSWDE